MTAGSTVAAALAAVLVPDVHGALKARFSDPEPLTAVVQSFNDCTSGRYLVPATSFDPEALPSPSSIDSSWARGLGGGDASGTVYQVTVQGTSEIAVVLDGLDVVGVRDFEPPGDLVVLSRCTGGGDLYPRRFDVDLVHASPIRGRRRRP